MQPFFEIFCSIDIDNCIAHDRDGGNTQHQFGANKPRNKAEQGKGGKKAVRENAEYGSHFLTVGS